MDCTSLSGLAEDCSALPRMSDSDRQFLAYGPLQRMDHGQVLHAIFARGKRARPRRDRSLKVVNGQPIGIKLASRDNCLVLVALDRHPGRSLPTNPMMNDGVAVCAAQFHKRRAMVQEKGVMHLQMDFAPSKLYDRNNLLFHLWQWRRAENALAGCCIEQGNFIAKQKPQQVHIMRCAVQKGAPTIGP